MKINSLSESLINEIDASGDGQVTELEFVLYMLRKYELVDEGLLQSFFDNFRSLDTDGSGVLTLVERFDIEPFPDFSAK